MSAVQPVPPVFGAILDFPVKPGELEAALAALTPGLADTRAFPGNLSVEIFLDDDPTHFLLVELWETAEHDAAYQAWRATPEGTIPGFASHLAGPFTVAPYTVAPH